MLNHKSSVAASCVVLAFMVTAASGHASDMYPRTFLSFSKEVSLPGVTLAPGTYVFEVANPLSSSNVVRVRSKEDYRHVYFTGFTYRIDRPAGPNANRSVIFGEASPGAAPPILAWFPTGTRMGHEFIYRR